MIPAALLLGVLVGSVLASVFFPKRPENTDSEDAEV